MRGQIRIGARGPSVRGRRLLRLAPLAAAVAVYISGSAGAATIAVNDANDASLQGKCTLVDAVDAINNAAATNGCAAGDGVNDTVDLSFFTAATTISLMLPHSLDAQSGLGFSKPAAIVGPLGEDGKPLVTIQRSSTSGLSFRVIGTTADLAITGVNVSGGKTTGRGGGVYADAYANLTVNNSVISGNAVTQPSYSSGGGIASVHGNITLTNSSVSGNTAANAGGGIYCKIDGLITLNSSTVSGNSTYNSGGGIYSFNGNVTLNSSTVSGNVAGITYTDGTNFFPRGGLYAGGIFVYQAVHMTNSTVAYNRANLAGGGIYAAQPFYGRPGHAQKVRPLITSTLPHPTGAVYMYASTVANNSLYPGSSPGGIAAQAYMRAVSSLISSNSGGNLFIAHGSPMGFTGNNNIIFGDDNPPNNQPADTLNCDPMLASLADTGGPTKTMGLFEGSCAIDAGPDNPPNGLTVDQRGLPRVVGDHTDIGAVEKQGPNDPPPNEIFTNGFE